MNHLIFYLLVKPISMLPLWALYGISNFLYVVLYRIFRYRVKVVSGNIARSFPEKSVKERKKIEKAFYSYFFDLILETLKHFSISAEEIKSRVKMRNIEMIDRFAEEGQSVFLLSGHYGNWELAAMGIELYSKHKMCGIYHPLKNKFWNKKLQESRSRLGMDLVSKRELSGYFEKTMGTPIGTLIATDQSPSNPYRAYWTNFLNQDTAVLFGTEKFGKDYNQPIYFGKIIRTKRGHYEVEFVKVTDEPRSLPYGEITERHTKILEDLIREAPAYWLWTHKRWKRTKPDDYQEHLEKMKARV